METIARSSAYPVPLTRLPRTSTTPSLGELTAKEDDLSTRDLYSQLSSPLTLKRALSPYQSYTATDLFDAAELHAICPHDLQYRKF